MDLSAVRAQRSRREECVTPDWAIVLGGADCVWDDVLAFTYGIQPNRPTPWPGLWIAANDVGVHCAPLDHWVSFHVNKFERWKQLRELERWQYPEPRTWGTLPGQPVDFVALPWSGGSSGMLAVQVALHLGCTKIVLCGIPMVQAPHFLESQEFTPETTVWRESDLHWRAWVRVQAQGWFEGKVRSMSGRTRELFGAPTTEWLLT